MRRRLIAATLAATGLTIGPATAAQARPPTTAPARTPVATLRLMITDGPATRVVTLTCAPPGGTHPQAARACADIEQAHGNLARLPGERTMHACFMIYAPVRVSAIGEWRGRPIAYRAGYGNACVLHAQTGPVFAF